MKGQARRASEWMFTTPRIHSLARRACLVGLLLLLGNTQSSHAQSTETDWPLFRGDQQSSGVARTTLPAEPEVVWQFKVPEGSFESTPVIVARLDEPSLAVIGDLDGRVFALNLKDGKQLWKLETGEIGFTAAPAYHDGRLFIGDLDGFFHCIDLTGKLLWKFEAGGEINGSANFYKGWVLFGSADGGLYALDRATGKLAWKYQADDQIQCSITVVGERAFLAGCDGKLHIVDLEGGKEAQKVAIDSPTGTTPAALGDHVFLGTQQGAFLAVDWKTAKVAWQRDDPLGGTTIMGSAAVDERQVVFGLRNRQLVSLDPVAGKERWTTQLKNKIDSSPVIVGQRILAASTDGRVYLVNHKNGEIQWQIQLNGSIIGSPAVAANRIVVATDRGVVYGLGTPAK